MNEHRADIPKPPQDWWEQVPVLRELFKLLSSTDPVNWDLARQVAYSLGSHDEPPSEDFEDCRRELETMSRAAQVQCEQFTGLVPGTVAPVIGVTRGQWVEENVAVFKMLMEPLAAKLTGPALTGGIPVPIPESAAMVLRQIGGVLMGLQTGFVLGYLSRHVIGQYELVLPDPSGGRLLYVIPNMQQAEQDWELDPREFRYWIALHEVTHHLEFSRPWTRRYFHSQIQTMIDSLDFDPARLQETLEGFDITNPEKMAETLQDPEALIQAAWTPLGLDTMSRLQAFMTLVEGYATFVMDAVGAAVLKDHARLKEVMERRKRTSSPGEQLLERLLGLELKRKQYDAGVKFCRYVAGVHDVAFLNKAWDNPDSLPTASEIDNPDGWIERMSEAGL
ncbi:MAG TPA: zinc-dependent metalloprotease [Actinomycetota bacterium]|nr:zinc-dependent metalloprotease [Actinomycetota bacterium]